MIGPRTVQTEPKLAGWRPRGTKHPDHRVRIDPDVGIPLSDGVTLRGDLYRPRSKEPAPALVGWSPYNKDIMPTGFPAPFNEPGAVGFLAQQGFAVLVVSARGAARSGGEMNSLFTDAEIDDLCEVIEWLGAQEWCDGNVGMTGMSYFGISQLRAAAQRPPSLKAIFPFGAHTDFYRHAVYPGGSLQSEFVGPFTAINGSVQRVRIPPARRHAAAYLVGAKPVQRLIRRVMARRVLKLTASAHPPEGWVELYADLALRHTVDGPFYRERSAGPRLKDIAIPVLLGTEWSMVGLHLFGAFDAWHALTCEKKLIIGPPTNEWPFTRYQEELLAFYRHAFYDEDNGYDELPPVRYWLMGAERWERSDDWPPPDTELWRLHLHHSVGLDGAPMLFSEPAEDRSQTRSWSALPRHMVYPGELDRYHPQTLAYSSGPVGSSMHVAGPAHLTLQIASSAIDTFIQARLSVMSAAGRRRVLSVGRLLASHREVDATRCNPTEIVHNHTAPRALTPDQPVELRFSLTPFAVLLRADERLVLEVGSDPRLLEAPHSDGFVYFQSVGTPYPALNTVIHAGSVLELRVRAG